MLQLTITVYRVNEAKKISKMRINVTMNLSVGRTILCQTWNYNIEYLYVFVSLCQTGS
jgi:hypothetical protein